MCRGHRGRAAGDGCPLGCGQQLQDTGSRRSIQMPSCILHLRAGMHTRHVARHAFAPAVWQSRPPQAWPEERR